MSTVWQPESHPRDWTWVLEDGRTIAHPELEESGSRRRVRLKGRQKTSTPISQRSDLVAQGVEEAVRRLARGKLLTCVPTSRLSGPEPLPPAKLSVGNERIKPLTCTWLFRHDSLPLEATIDVALTRRYYDYEVKSSLSFDTIDRHGLRYPRTSKRDASGWSVSHAELNDSPGPFTYRGCRSERESILVLRNMIEEFSALDEVQIPDLRELEVNWLDLRLVDTNVDGELLATIADYLNSNDLVDQIHEKYQELRQLVGKLGIVMDERAPDDFQQAAISGERALAIKLDGEPDGSGTKHSVLLHLATGTFTVVCPRTVSTLTEKSDKWELARFEAEMRGELASFLAHCEHEPLKAARHEVIGLIDARSTGSIRPTA